jgi:sugar phosphate isomerase/epimerase
MLYSRREIARLALATVPATAMLGRSAFAQGKPNSVINGVHVGTITYSYRSMPDQTAEALLRYTVASGISEIELMGQPAEQFAGAPQAARGGGGRGRGRGQQATPEQQAAQQAAQREAQEATKRWRLSASMERYKALRKLYNDAGVTIYALKLPLTMNMSEDEYAYVFNAAEAVGANHVTLELPEDVELLKRIGAFAEKKKIYAAYHTHTQATISSFDQAFAVSKANMANIDLGHYVAGTGQSPIPFLQKFHNRIASFHMKDRQTPAHGAGNLPWGEGDTPLKEILQTVKKNRWTMPATIELEYEVPEGSDAVKEVAKCLQYCREALA